MADRRCSDPTCDRPITARGMCHRHYMNWYNNTTEPKVPHASWPQNLLSQMEPQPNGCIYFTRWIGADGYGRLHINRRQTVAHRAAYEYFVGPIPEGFQVDHVCHNSDPTCVGVECMHRRCVNPDHLEAKLPGDNQRASSQTVASINLAKTECPAGHPYDDANTYRDPTGRRHCRECRREVDRKRNAAKRRGVAA